MTGETRDIHAAITAVWNNKDDEEYRKDQSHYRGFGRWADDAAWKEIGQSSLQKVQFLWRLANRSKDTLKDLSVMEWGPGGGANAFGLQQVARQYYGVDISQKNLDECCRMMTIEGRENYVVPILLEGEPSSVVPRVKEPIELFLSTAVFQHFPSRAYGVDVLEAVRAVCSSTACGFVQIRFDNGNTKYSGINSVEEYAARHITATSYPIDTFWDELQRAGFAPLAVNAIRTTNNYATFYFRSR